MTDSPLTPPENTKQTKPLPAISHLQRREIQAPVASALIKAFAEIVGETKALEIAAAAIQSDAVTAGLKTAEISGSNGIKDLARVVKDVWAQDDAITLQILAETDRFFYFDVTHCCYAELYEKMGVQEMGFCLSCCRDEAFARGFNPKIKLSRSHTIMQGDLACDFRFELE